LIAERNEKRFRALVEHVGDIISLTDKEGKIIYISPALEKILGFTTDEVLGKPSFALMHPDHREESKNILVRLLENPGVLIPRINRFMHKNGNYVWVEGSAINLLHDENVQGIVSNYRNVTERKETEEKLIASEKKFRTIIENNHDAVLLSDANFQPFYQSPSVEKILGWTFEERKAKSELEFIHPEDIKLAGTNKQFAIDNPGALVYCSHRIKHKNGNYICTEGTLINLLHEPDINAFVFNFRDVTEKKAFERQKEFDSSNLKALINNTHDLMWSVDTDLKLITSNQPFNEMVKIMCGKIINKGEEVLVPEFGEGQLKIWRSFYERAFAGEIFTATEHSGAVDDTWSEISFYPITEGGVVIGTACHSRDITAHKKAKEDLKKSETKLKQAQAIAHVGSWELSFSDNRSVWSEEACRIYGLAPEDNIHPFESWFSFIHPDDQTFVKDEIKKAQAGLKDSSFNHRIILKDGKEKHIHSVSKFKFDENGKPSGLYGIALDVTERKETEEKIIQSEKQVRNFVKHLNDVLEDERTRIAREIHDELGQRLAGLKFGLSSLKKQSDLKKIASDKVSEMITDVDDSIQSLRKIATELRPGILDTLGLIASIEWLASEFEKKTGIKCLLHVEVKEQVFANKISICFFRICQEGLNNVGKHSNASEVTISIKQNGTALEILISDNGKGIENERLENPFSLGIVGMRERAEMINGTFEIKSKKGSGTSIRLEAVIA
ncbi:MAG: PAS domain-containing sensor histidine kinase, partial [Bacteroidia bacterium]